VDDCKYKIPNLIFTLHRAALLAILAELLSFRIDAGLPENKIANSFLSAVVHQLVANLNASHFE
jgi:hypothetical protein